MVWFAYWGCCRIPHIICSSVCPNLVPRSLLPYCFSHIVYDHKLDNSEDLGTRQNGTPRRPLFGVHDHHPLFTYGDGAFCLYYVNMEVHIWNAKIKSPGNTPCSLLGISCFFWLQSKSIHFLYPRAHTLVWSLACLSIPSVLYCLLMLRTSCRVVRCSHCRPVSETLSRMLSRVFLTVTS